MLLEEVSESLEEFVVGVAVVAFVDDRLCGREEFRVDDGLVGVVAPHPLGGLVHDAWCLEFRAGAVVQVVPDVLLVRQDFVDGTARPGSSRFCEDALVVEEFGDLCFGVMADCEEVVDAARSRLPSLVRA